MHFAENDKKFCAQNENDKACWTRGWKRYFAQNSALCLKSLISVVRSAKIIKRTDLRLKTLICSLDKLVHFAKKLIKSGAPSAKMTKRADVGKKTLFCSMDKLVHCAEKS